MLFSSRPREGLLSRIPIPFMKFINIETSSENAAYPGSEFS